MDIIPDEVLVHILSFASHSTRTVRLVCKKWKTIQDTDIGIHLATKRGHIHGMKLAVAGNWKLLSAEIPITSCSVPIEPLVGQAVHKDTAISIFIGDAFPNFPVALPPQTRAISIRGSMFHHVWEAIGCVSTLSSLDIRWRTEESAVVTNSFIENSVLEFAPNLEFLTLHCCTIDAQEYLMLLANFDKVGNRVYPFTALGDNYIGKITLHRRRT